MNDIVLITPPVAEPVTLNDLKLQLGFGPMQDSDRAASQILNEKLRAFIIAARQDCENWCNRAFITQTWLLKLNSWPGSDARYEWRGYPAIELPKPPAQSIYWVKYIDTSGSPQTLPFDTSYGNASLQYGYQFVRGSETQNGRLLPSWARPWPPVRMVPANVIVQFRCGYGGPITCSMQEGSALLTVAGGAPLTFNADDAPALPGETGTPISVTGAGPGGAVLDTFIASVNPANGQATLANAASASVTSVPGWAGRPVPAVITTAIKMLAEFYYENGGCEDMPLPRVVESLLDPYRNLVA